MGDDATLRVLRDIEEIKQLKARYIRFVDTQDWDAWRNLMTDDFRLQSDAGIHEGRDAVVSMVASALDGGSTVHHALTPEIAISDRDTATGTWAIEDLISLPGDGVPVAFRCYGYTHEQYVRTREGWRCKSLVETIVRVEPVGDARVSGGTV